MISCLDLKFQALRASKFCYTERMSEYADQSQRKEVRDFILSFIQTAKEEITLDRYFNEASKYDTVSEFVFWSKLKASVFSHITESHPSISLLTARCFRQGDAGSLPAFEWLVEHGGECFNMDGVADMTFIRQKIEKEFTGKGCPAYLAVYQEDRQPGGLEGMTGWMDRQWWAEQMKRVDVAMAHRQIQDNTLPARRQSAQRRGL